MTVGWRGAPRACQRRSRPAALALAGPLQVDAAVRVALALQSLAASARAEQVDGRLLEVAGSEPGRDVLLRPRLNHPRRPPVGGEQVGAQ